MDFLSASQAILWYATLDLSVMPSCIILSRAGGMYAPPVRVVRGSGSTRFLFGGGVASTSPSEWLGGVGGVWRLLSPLSLSRGR